MSTDQDGLFASFKETMVKMKCESCGHHDGTEGHATGYITEFEVNVSDPVPVPFVNAALGECGASQWPFGENATFTGHAHISNRDGA